MSFRSTLLSLSLGLAFGLAIAAMAVGSSSLGQNDSFIGPAALIALFAAAIGLGRALAKASDHPRPAAAAALGAVGLAPVAFFAAWHQLEAPLGSASRLEGLEAAAAVIAFAVVASAAWRLTARSCPSSRAALALALASSAVVATAGVVSLFERPAPGVYLASLEPVASWTSNRNERGFEEHRPDRDLAVGGTCVGSGCYAHVHRDGEVRPIAVRLERGSSVDLVRDPSDDTLLLRANGSLLALLGEGGELVPNPAALHDRLGPPTSFVWLAYAGLAGSLFAWLWRRRQERIRKELEGASAGYVSEHGWLEVEQREAPRRLASSVIAGPVLVTQRLTSSAYRGARDDDPPLVHGTRGEILARLDARVGTLDALALSWALVLATPMATAVVRGLAP